MTRGVWVPILITHPFYFMRQLGTEAFTDHDEGLSKADISGEFDVLDALNNWLIEPGLERHVSLIKIANIWRLVLMRRKYLQIPGDPRGQK